MNDSIFAFVLVPGLWGFAVSEYMRGRRRDWPFLALGTLAGLAAMLLAGWDLSANLGKLGDWMMALAVLIVALWSAAVGWKYIRPGS